MVIVLDKRKRPMGFTTERRARKLLEKRRACVYRKYPFTIIVKDRDVRDFEVKTHHIKIDPGSKYTGVAIVDNSNNSVKMFIQLEHRGDVVKSALEIRNQVRRNRRSRETRYRRCKYINHYMKKDSKYKAESPRPEGWLPPSVKSVADNIINLIWALVFVPEGVDPSSINLADFPNSRSLYEPNQNVIMSGVFSSGQSKIISTKLARNLNYGDRIMLLIWHPEIPPFTVGAETDLPTRLYISALLSYAICFN